MALELLADVASDDLNSVLNTVQTILLAWLAAWARHTH